MDDSERTFLSRWSRRKALRQEELDETTISGTEQVVSEAPDSAEDKAPLPTDDDMPPIESLGEDDNYGDFLSPEVSEKLRKVALRKLFHGAGFNIRDGLDDYDEVEVWGSDPNDTDTDDGTPVDLDGDGYPASQDCDDHNAEINPDEVEICDGYNNDCKGDIDGEGSLGCVNRFRDFGLINQGFRVAKTPQFSDFGRILRLPAGLRKSL